MKQKLNIISSFINNFQENKFNTKEYERFEMKMMMIIVQKFFDINKKSKYLITFKQFEEKTKIKQFISCLRINEKKQTENIIMKNQQQY